MDRRQVSQVMDGDLIWMTLITDAEGGRVNWMIGFVFWFAGWCLIVQFSPGGCLILQVFCDAACRGLNRRAVARVLAQSKVIFIQVLAD